MEGLSESTQGQGLGDRRIDSDACPIGLVVDIQVALLLWARYCAQDNRNLPPAEWGGGWDCLIAAVFTAITVIKDGIMPYHEAK